MFFMKVLGYGIVFVILFDSPQMLKDTFACCINCAANVPFVTGTHQTVNTMCGITCEPLFNQMPFVGAWNFDGGNIVTVFACFAGHTCKESCNGFPCRCLNI